MISKESNNNDQYSCIQYIDKFGVEKELRPSDEQLKIITSDMRQDQKIIACAGSGKTTTLVARLKYLIDHGVPAESIIISTFNVEAGRNILNRAKELIGIEKAKLLEIGNIDKIAFKMYSKFIKEKNTNNQSKEGNLASWSVRLSVKEYCFELFKFLKTRDGIKYILDKYKYFFFDEFQDVNQLQYQILMLFKKHGCYLVVIELRPYLQSFKGLYDQNEEIIRQIKFKLKKYELKDFAILCPMNLPLKFFEEALEKHNQRSNNEQKLLYASFIKSADAYQAQNSSGQKPQQLNRITLSTIHRAKGLEWKVVFFIGLNDEFFPSKFLRDAESRLTKQEECRRLFYVGCTRAIDELYFAFTNTAKYFRVCRFFQDIKENYYEKDIEVSEHNLIFESEEKVMEVERDTKVTSIISQLEHDDFAAIDLLLQTGIEETRLSPAEQHPVFAGSLQSQAQLLSIEAERMHSSDLNINSGHHKRGTNTQSSQVIHGKCWINENEIRNNNLHIDLGLYIDLYVQRRLAEGLGAENGYSCEYARIVIFSLFWANSRAEIINKYSLFFKNPMLDIDEMDTFEDFMDQFIMFFKFGKGEAFSKEIKITKIEESELEEVFLRLQDFLGKYKVPYSTLNNVCLDDDNILEFKEYFPKGFKIDEYVQSFKRFTDPTLLTQDVLQDVYFVSKCGQLQDMTRKVLYRNDFEILHPKNLSQNIDQFIVFMKSMRYKRVRTKYVVHHGLNLKGEIDILADDTIYEIKASQYAEITKENLIQALAYASLMKVSQSYQINKLAFYNPILGRITTYDISKWEFEERLVRFLIQKSIQLSNEKLLIEEDKSNINGNNEDKTASKQKNMNVDSIKTQGSQQKISSQPESGSELARRSENKSMFEMPDFNEIGSQVAQETSSMTGINQTKPLFDIKLFSKPKSSQSKLKNNQTDSNYKRNRIVDEKEEKNEDPPSFSMFGQRMVLRDYKVQVKEEQKEKSEEKQTKKIHRVVISSGDEDDNESDSDDGSKEIMNFQSLFDNLPNASKKASTNLSKINP